MRGVRAILLADKGSTVRGLPLGLPLALIDVLGKSILQRTIDHLRAAGVEDVTVVADISKSELLVRNGIALQNAALVEAQGDVFTAAQSAFQTAAEDDASPILLFRVNAYVELDVFQLLSHHSHFRNRITRAWFGKEPIPLDVFVVNSSRRDDGMHLICNALRESSLEGVRYRVGPGEYVNSLRDARDLRQLASDALHLRCRMEPVGQEIRPGIWAEESSTIARDARLVAPIYIGQRSKIRAGAVVTRGSSVEHHSTVDCGTVVENATILPYSQIGPCLDLSNSVAGDRHIVHLKKNVVTEIHDGRLLSALSSSPMMRALTMAESLFSFLPQHFCRGLFGQSSNMPATAVPAAAFGTTRGFNSSSKEKADLPDMATGLAVVRRYGNQ